MKYLYIRLNIGDGEREYTQHLVINTNCQNLEFAVIYYTAHFGGYGRREKDYWWFDNEIIIEVDFWKEISKTEYNYLESLFYSNIRNYENKN